MGSRRAVLAALGLAATLAGQRPAPVHHPITTGSVAAQQAFDRGLALEYGFNFAAAERQFRRAAALDPGAPMPWWGLALALGPNLNAPWPSTEQERQASTALAKARTLAARMAPSGEADEERAYIAALTLRFTCQPRADYPRLAAAYAGAMGRLAARYPNDPDAAILYAAALMVERRNARWGALAPPLPKHAQILAVLRTVLHRWPGSIGANHFYIHAAEGAGDPGAALTSARVLDRLGGQGYPGDGHLLHMPAHVYLRTGHYRAAERSTLAAAAADRTDLAAHPGDGAYAFGYAQHNLQFLVAAASMDGDYPIALAAARELAADASADAQLYPGGLGRESAPLLVRIRFARWGGILRRHPVFTARSIPIEYARLSALAGQRGPGPLSSEVSNFRLLLNRDFSLRLGAPPMPLPAVHTILAATLAARVAASTQQWDFAESNLRRAIAAQDALGYREPPSWYPIRESLGSILLRAGEAAGAEAAFRDCLRHWPNDPRAEFGLARALAAEGRAAEAKAAMQSFQAEWKGGPLRLADF